MEIGWWDIGIIGAATYLALTLMIRLMLLRRNEVIADLSREVAEERAQQASSRSQPRDGDSRDVA